jgi:CopG family nickel-responsive transcriptional regulator
MEVTALKGSGGDVQHFADRIIAERGVRYGRVAMIRTSAKTKPRPHFPKATAAKSFERG